MKKICFVLVMLCGLYSVPSYSDEIRLSVATNLDEYPELVAIPGYPVYYAPGLQANYFFYDGDYWLYQDDNWYESGWYDGPWRIVDPEDVPVFILRIPVRYFLLPPVYFYSWELDDPPHWGEHWGRDWEDHRHGWDKWNHRIHRKPAPLPLYQRQYSGEQYPRQFEQQQELQHRHYRYQSHDPLVQKRHRRLSLENAPTRQNRKRSSENGSSMRQENSSHNRNPRQGGFTKDQTEGQGGLQMENTQDTQQRKRDSNDTRDLFPNRERSRDK